MNFASNFAYINKKSKPVHKEQEYKNESSVLGDLEGSEDDLNLNVFIVTFEGVKTA